MKRIRTWTTSQWAIALLGLGLLLSLAANCWFYTRLDGPLPPLRGTYCTNAARPGGEYLLLDGESRFCRYTQEEGFLDDGTFEEIGENRYALRSSQGRSFCALRTREGLTLFNGEENTVYSLSRMGKATESTYYLISVPEEQPDWLKSPA